MNYFALLCNRVFDRIYNRIYFRATIGVMLFLSLSIKAAYKVDNISHIKIPTLKNAVTRELFKSCARGDVRCVQGTLGKKAVINAQTIDGDTALMVAVLTNRRQIVRILLQHKADVDTQNKQGDTALMLAVRNDLDDIVRLLLQAKANIESENVKGSTALMVASLNDNSVLVRLLSEYKANMNSENKAGSTPLIQAVANGHISMVSLLLKYKADINFQNRYGNTALIHASKKNFVTIIHLLLEHKANIDLQNKLGDTALHYTIYYPVSARTLVLHGANVEIKNIGNKKVLDQAPATTVRVILNALTRRVCLQRELGQQNWDLEIFSPVRILTPFVGPDNALLVCAYAHPYNPTIERSLLHARKHHIRNNIASSLRSKSTSPTALSMTEHAVCCATPAHCNCVEAMTYRQNWWLNNSQYLPTTYEAILRKKLSYCFRSQKEKNAFLQIVNCSE